MISDEKSRKPVKLSSIINVVQHDPHPGHKFSQRKMELKSVVHVGNEKPKRPSSNGVKGHDLKSSKTSKSSAEKPILLLPFGHQVSGRASMLCYDETTILKPYVARELFFYQSMPEGLKKCTPQFRGFVTVSFIEDSTTASILAYALPKTLVKPNAKSIIKIFAEEPKPHSKRCVKDFGKTHVIYPNQSDETGTSVSDDDQNLFVEAFDFSPVISDAQNKEDDDVVSELSQGFDVTVCINDEPSQKDRRGLNLSTTGLHNPWNSKVLDDAWLKLKFSDTESPANGKKKRFTLLENVVARYRRPCVLDLKMGTRVRENASPEKIARHVTAINLGTRLSGMQIYHPKREKFTYHNKYYGHNLTVSGFKSNLRHFFSRGAIPIKRSSIKCDSSAEQSLIDKALVEQAIQKLTQLKEAVESMEYHRFYSSSLLLLYEGDVADEMECDEPIGDEIMEKVDDNFESEFKSEESQKITPTSSTLSEFLQRIKHTGSKHGQRGHQNSSPTHHGDVPHEEALVMHHADAAHENAFKHHGDAALKCASPKHQGDVCHGNALTKHRDDIDPENTSSHGHDDITHKNTSSKQSQDAAHCSKVRSHKCPESLVIHKEEKSRRRTRADGDSKISESPHHHHHHHCSKHHHDHASPTQSLHARSKSASKSKSLKLCDHHEKLLNKGDFQMENSSGMAAGKSSGHHKPQKHPLEEKMDESNDLTHYHKRLQHRDDFIKSQESSQYHNRRDLDVIDVRMIDFAHYCFHDKEMHPGPDGGFIFGLESLIKLLTDMLDL